MNLKTLIKKEHILSVAVSLALFACVPAVLAWAPPTATPPNSNTRGPIDTGPEFQFKSGKLGLYGNGVAFRVAPDNTYVPDDSNPMNRISTLLIGAKGKIGAKQYCDEMGGNCMTIVELKTKLGL